MDFFNTVYYTVGKTPYSWGNIPARNYLPFAYLLLYPFSKLYSYDTGDMGTSYAARYSQYSSIAACAFFILSFGFLFYLLYKKCSGSEASKIGVLIALFCSSVILFNLDRGNLQILTTALMILFIMTYRSEKKWLNHVGYISLAVAAALKLFPALLGVLILYDKKYKDAFITVLYGLAFAMFPFLWLNGSLISNVQLYFNALQVHAVVYADGPLGLSAPTIFNIDVNFFLLPYIMACLALLSAWCLQDEWKRQLLLALVLVMTSGQQGFYCLSFIFFPVVLFFNEKHAWKDFLYVIGFILILSPLQYSLQNAYVRLYPEAIYNTVCIIMYVVLLAESLISMVKTLQRWKFV